MHLDIPSMHIVYRVDNVLAHCPVGADSCGSCSPTVWMSGCLLPPGGLGRWYHCSCSLLGSRLSSLQHWRAVVSMQSEVQVGQSHRINAHSNISLQHILWKHMHAHTNTRACSHTCHLAFRIWSSRSPIHACVSSCVVGCTPAFFVSLIKADTVQSRGLRGEIKVLLLPRHGGGKWLPLN